MLVSERLIDVARPGAPNRITPEQWCQIMAIACEPPEIYNIPITHWTYKELAKQISQLSFITHQNMHHG